MLDCSGLTYHRGAGNVMAKEKEHEKSAARMISTASESSTALLLLQGEKKKQELVSLDVSLEELLNFGLDELVSHLKRATSRRTRTKAQATAQATALATAQATQAQTAQAQSTAMMMVQVAETLKALSKAGSIQAHDVDTDDEDVVFQPINYEEMTPANLFNFPLLFRPRRWNTISQSRRKKTFVSRSISKARLNQTARKKSRRQQKAKSEEALKEPSPFTPVCVCFAIL
jgi:hypothetical protein